MASCQALTGDIDFMKPVVTPLHTTAYHCSVDLTILLLEFGASNNALTNSYEKASDLTEHELILELLSLGESVEYV